MARFDSYSWDHNIGVCKKHMLPCIPCPACLQEVDEGTDTDMFISLSDFERSSFCDELALPQGFDSARHEVQ